MVERLIKQRTLRWAADQIEEIPASASLYENADTAKAVIEFKRRAVDLLRTEANK